MDATQGSTLAPGDTDDIISAHGSASSGLLNLSESSAPVPPEHAGVYYAGLPSCPPLLWRSSKAPWRTRHPGPEAYTIRKRLRPVFGHTINEVWDELGPKVCQLLDSKALRWTSIDVVRFQLQLEVEEPVGPVVLWVGVDPESAQDPSACGIDCLKLLHEFGLDDVEVEFRASSYIRSSSQTVRGPRLLPPVSELDPTVAVRAPFTATLGLSIAAQATLGSEGTGGLYIAQGGSSSNILLLTTRHVILPPDVYPNDDFSVIRLPDPSVTLLGERAASEAFESCKTQIDLQTLKKRITKNQIAALSNQMAALSNEGAGYGDAEGEITRDQLKATKSSIRALKRFGWTVKRDWAEPTDRIIGRFVHAPPIILGAAPEGFTQDYALVQLDMAKFGDAFRGNVVDLGTEIHPYNFFTMMREFANPFKYPVDRLLQLQDVIPLASMRNPEHVNRNGDPGLVVLKRGKSTGITVGLATGVFSYVREYSKDQSQAPRTSQEWPVLPFGNGRGDVFSDVGDSGSVIVDGLGRVGGLITGGSGQPGPDGGIDVTYATPLCWLLSRIQASGFPDARVYSRSQ
ncbi:hypothetical protein EXIGLDRAFT_789708 [Exidia glandulosa HHB12029]|uniref:Uncharacterized protein n=1 Tax=Exidia glandulosa HHB12029 TaxID=1314781 RepID=A0A166AKE2_EXIGL|nr:hypothetical protein EXIGLDRAFT_789708 [Exidia glandulosa HHB12029]